MKNGLIFVLAISLACSEPSLDDKDVSEKEIETDSTSDERIDEISYSWEKIELPSRGTVQKALSLSEKYLIVSLSDKILKIEKDGWTIVSESAISNPIKHFLLDNDSIFGIGNFTNYVSIDDGNSWAIYENERLEVPGRADTLKTDQGWFALHQTSLGECGLPTEVMFSEDDGDSWTSIFPFNYPLRSIVFDPTRNVVLLGTHESNWNEEINCFSTVLNGHSLLYIGLRD